MSNVVVNININMSNIVVTTYLPLIRSTSLRLVRNSGIKLIYEHEPRSTVVQNPQNSDDKKLSNCTTIAEISCVFKVEVSTKFPFRMYVFYNAEQRSWQTLVDRYKSYGERLWAFDARA
ncbi:uncharacterized protein LOC143144527 [Ptiloglossa arizonensis]|uniref:uncharacterized protein LOC143144527 n=1 Tax=Ptiloglossa arizonensis TaxID=3350558 RepID=UPI003F9F607F